MFPGWLPNDMTRAPGRWNRSVVAPVVRASRGRFTWREKQLPVASDKAANNAYGASSITVLKGLEAVRKRPGMYIGSTGERGLHHLIWEVVDNSVDEAMAGHATKVVVTLQADGGIRVEDDGRGIPVEMHPVEKKPTLEVVLTSLHAGGKFDDKSYAVSGGLHGVGVSVVNALSTALDVEVRRDGKIWRQHYEYAVPGELVEAGTTKKSDTGTTITYWADPKIFETTTYTLETIRRRLQEQTFLNKGSPWSCATSAGRRSRRACRRRTRSTRTGTRSRHRSRRSTRTPSPTPRATSPSPRSTSSTTRTGWRTSSRT